MYENKVKVGEKEFTFRADCEPVIFSFEKVSEVDEICEYELSVNMGEQGISPLTIKWSNHMEGILSYWGPTADRKRGVRQWIWPSENLSNMYYGAPLISVIKQGDENFSTVAVSDAVNPIRMTFAVNDFEEKENLDFHMYLFEGWNVEGTYTVRIRIDERAVPYYEAIPQVSKWWKDFYPTQSIVAECAEYPLYSTWYNYHQNPTQESLEKELVEAVKCGMKSIIIDDGWSYEGQGTGDYSNCGDWAVTETKFPNFKEFVDKAHHLGVKVAVWFPVPFVGYNTKDYQKFQGKILYNSDKDQAGILDPRYPDVRKHIVNTFADMANEYDLDGLKLDFIDSFRCWDASLLCTDKCEGRDCNEVEEGVIRLLREIRETLTGKKQDFMIEFRQYYVGPAIVRDTNMLRVIDCAFDTVTNRIGIVDLRLMNYDLAVHADMLLWAQDEMPVNCAKMLLNIMFGVPQFSVLLQNSSEEQKKVISQHIAYWEANKGIILHGTFKAENPETGYSFVSSENEEKCVAVAYAKNEVFFTGKETDVFNATAKEYFYIENGSGQDAKAVTVDCMGTQIEECTIKSGICKVQVPEGGMVKIQ